MGGIHSNTRVGIQAETNKAHGKAVLISNFCVQGVHEKRKAIGSVCIPSVTRNFFGRINELSTMKAILSRSNYAIIQGMAGAGKTSTAIQYLCRYCSGYKYLVWVDSETKAAMTERFKDVAKRLGIKTSEYLAELQSFSRSEIEEIYAALCEHPTILVFDNAEGYSDIKGKRDGIQHFLPPPICKSTFFGLRRRDRYKVIVTTRYMKGWDKICSETDIIPLGKLPANDCKLLIIERLKTVEISDINENWQMLADYYDYLPIAIESATGLLDMLAVATRSLSGKSYTIIEFVEEFVTKQSLVSIEPDDENEAHHKLKSLWDKTFEKLESVYEEEESGTDAIHLLNVLAFLSSDGVEIDYFLKIMQGIDKVTLGEESTYKWDKVDPAVDILQRLSLVQMKEVKLVVHRLLHDNRMKHMLSNDTAISYAVKLCYALNQGGGSVRWLQSQNIHAFGIKLQSFIKDDGILQALEENIILLEEFPFSSGVQVYEQILDQNSRKHGPHHKRTLCILDSLVEHISRFGYHDRTVALLKTHLVAQIHDLGKDDERTLKTRNKLADQLGMLGQLTDSLNLLQSDWDRQKSEIGPDDQRTLETRSKIVDLLDKQGQRMESLHFLQSDWDRQKSALGQDNPRTIETRNEIASKLFFYGQRTETLNLLQSDWDRQKTELGPDDPRTLETRNKLADQFRRQGQLTESLNVLESDWDREKSALGPDDPRTLETRNEIASKLFFYGQRTETLNLLQSDWDRQKTELGPDDPRTLETRNKLADQFRRQGQLTESLNVLQSDWDRQKSALDRDEPCY